MDEDYIKTLSAEERIIFLKVFCAMVRADGVIDAEEINFLKKQFLNLLLLSIF